MLRSCRSVTQRCVTTSSAAAQMLETHENDEFIAAEAADGVAATSAARWEQRRCATRELLRLTRQRDNVRSFRGTCALSVRSARLRSSDCRTLQGVQGAPRARLS